MALRETENNAYAKFWSDQQRVLWYVMVFSGVVNWYVKGVPFVNGGYMKRLPVYQKMV